jgi:hypothetical protein
MSTILSYDDLKRIMDIAEPLAVIITCFFWIYYLHLTRMTFQEIRKQTDSQTRAVVNISWNISKPERPRQERIFSSRHGRSLDGDQYVNGLFHDLEDVHNTFKDHYNHHFQAVERDEMVAWLVLENIGRSPVLDWSIDIEAEIEPGDFYPGRQITGTKRTWTVKKKKMIMPSQKAQIKIAQIQYYPKIKFKVDAKMEDSIGRMTSVFGDKEKDNTNQMICDGPEKAGDK